MDNNKQSNPVADHAQPAAEVLSLYQSSEQGLTDAEAAHRKQQYGTNSLPLAAPKPAWLRLVLQFHNVLIYVLIVSALVSAALQHYVDCGVIVAVVVVNALVGFIQEGKAEDALRAIMTMAKTRCMVMRAGVLVTIDSADVVPGDVVMLQAGDRVPADMRLFFCKDLRCDESALTGESQPVDKQLQALPAATPLAERNNMAYMGTMVTFGLARGVVTRTGLQTQIGAISDLVGQVEMPQTPLQQQLAVFARQLTMLIVLVALATVALGVYLHGYSLKVMFQAAIGIAVAAIPEGLPAIVTIALAIGVQRMAANHALVRRLPSVEVLGSVDVICTDKTGTLTANAMTAREAVCQQQRYLISGEAYKPEGAISNASTQQILSLDHTSVFSQASLIAMLCNDANVLCEQGEWILHGDPTEGALLVMAMKHGWVLKQALNDWPRIDILPFDSGSRYMATLHHNNTGLLRLMVKGAPERLLSFATQELGPQGPLALAPEQWQQAIDDMAQRGMRVMALAYKDYSKRPQALCQQDVEQGLVMVALVGISDPPRPEAISSVSLCQTAGIQVKMITGDNPVTAAAIAKELGLNASKVLTGSDLDKLSEASLAQEVENTDVFARTSPANKLQLVAALQRNRHVVAMTGDGVNDAPALKKANIGVAMGGKGTDAAKEAADFILTDDNFSTIAQAVAAGRTVYDNILKSIIFILPTNLAEALVIISAIMLGSTMPITPAQILWVNTITAVTLALALAFERAEPHIMHKPPRPYGQGFFTASLLGRMVLVGAVAAFIVFSLFYYYRSLGVTIEFARTIAINALVMIELYYLLNCRFLSQSIFNRHFFKGVQPAVYAIIAVLVLQLTFTYLPYSQQLFGLASISAYDWLIIILSALPILIIVELEKYLLRLWKK
ncbi:HAD-IC family P-type ATPase [Dasania sp. GY-MA-18]|uniref:HAD-IC family P-type ATPase n=1 Tax=Dasania phycosphaerae TaxID=2950436 RepID=A0A9J6RSN0_9GAMM|nr:MULTISPECIES: HAD-IC family P-type ATPase [Dasania]MCR8924418.1 HAD-IC family P-type ATPase [Dasania sp. GY-MA-18]MCZ0867093.1 HAD-IC family P-type ATPase [Dasania phycosphaerae]MCZ0870545.1 HAD-IC family P-type ATPase [Dasania phycosphaerae]